MSVLASGGAAEGTTPESSKLSLTEKIGYGFGDTASNFYWQAFLNFLSYFYTDVFGLTATAAGTLLLAMRVPDTCLDPVMGVIADRTRTRWGHYRPYLLWGCLPLALLGVATFTTPDLGPQGKLVYAYVTYGLLMLAYTFINIPYGALMGVISPNSLERTSVSSYRFVLAYGGLLAVQGLTIPMVRRFGHGNERQGFQSAMVVYGVLAIVLFLTTFFTTRERVETAPRPGGALRDDLRDLLQNVPWLTVSCAGVFAVFYISLRIGAILYYFKYCALPPGHLYHFEHSFLGYRLNSDLGPEAVATWFMVLGTVGVIFGAAMARPLSTLLGGKQRAYAVLMALASTLTVLFYFVPLSNIPLIFVTHIAISVLFGPTSPLLWALYADTADYSEWKTGRRATGLLFSAAVFSQKLGWAAASSLFLWLIGHVGFTANVPQQVSVQNSIRSMMSFYPAVAGLLSVGAALLYRLSDAAMGQIESDLKQRRPGRS